MKIERLSVSHAPACELIYEEARGFMRKSGNATQWTGGYPSREVILDDIEKGQLYGIFEEERQIGVFCFFVGEDETYKKIYDGEWQSRGEYGVVHRVAIANCARGRGASALCFDFALERASSVRIDTHKDNIPMQKALVKNGFKRCGIIYLLNGDERIAYEKCK